MPSKPGILIVGATSAIATACARRWARAGARLHLVGRDTDKLEAVAADLRVLGATVVSTAQLEATDLAAHPAMLESALTELGQIDIALIAHGSLPDQAACQVDAALAAREFEVNATSVIALLTLLGNHLEAQRHGALAVISSVAGDRGRGSNYVYGSAKAAVQAFCEGLGARLFPAGISVTDIRPGFVATPMTAGLPLPAALVAKPEAIAPRIIQAIERGRPVVYVPGWWALIMLVIRAIPRPLFKRLKL